MRGERSPGWWLWLRRLVSFTLGVAVIVDALRSHEASVGKLIVGLVMIGVLPLDDLLRVVADRGVFHKRQDERDDDA